jgi:DNA topoisomerase-3
VPSAVSLEQVQDRMPVKALNVAEKPSVAKEVSRILSNGAARSRRGRYANRAYGRGQPQQLSAANSAAVLHCLRARFNPIWEFGYTIQGTPCDMVFTSVAGHLMQMDFTQQHKRWHSCSPLELYTAPVVKTVPDVSAVAVSSE